MSEITNYVKSQRQGRVASPQTKRTPGRTDEVRNNAGGFVFTVSDRDRFLRFLILGTESNTYYVGANEQTKESVAFVEKYIKANTTEALADIEDVSANGRAKNNDYAIFALAVAMQVADDKAAVRAVVNRVVRTATHLYTYTDFLKGLGGMGRAKRKSLAEWFTSKDDQSLSYQAVKYRQRNGWTLRDVMRIAHPQGIDTATGNFILTGEVENANLPIVHGFAMAQKSESVEETVDLIKTYNLPWEALRTEHLTDAEVWKTLFYSNQLNGQALVRNITRLARMGAFQDMQFAADYADKLTDEKMILKTRLHPINYLNAAVVYSDGQKDRNSYGYRMIRNKNWTTESVIKDALNDGFHTAFKAVEPAGKRTMVAVDVSGSMASPAMGLDLSCAQVSGAVAMTIARTERASIIRGFTSGSRGWGNTGLTDLNISAKTSLNQAMKNVQRSNFGGTDCALPMVWAKENNVAVDTFVVITDNETYAGSIKPTQALKQYRDATGIPARLAVFGVSGTPFTIADPTDKGQMDFVGFDSNAPKVLADFSAGRI